MFETDLRHDPFGVARCENTQNDPAYDSIVSPMSDFGRSKLSMSNSPAPVRSTAMVCRKIGKRKKEKTELLPTPSNTVAPTKFCEKEGRGTGSNHKPVATCPLPRQCDQKTEPITSNHHQMFFSSNPAAASDSHVPQQNTNHHRNPQAINRNIRPRTTSS